LLFNDNDIFNKIMNSKHPKEYKELGRKIKNFSDSKWNENKYQIVLKGNIAKFSQNEKLKAFLLNTGTKILVEASPYDKIWGIGLSAEQENIENPLTWNGENLLGFALMEVRDLISQ
ncbi:NADAR family protein, partial [Fusobacterium sp.]